MCSACDRRGFPGVVGGQFGLLGVLGFWGCGVGDPSGGSPVQRILPVFGVGLDGEQTWHDACVWWDGDCSVAHLESLGVLIGPFGKCQDRWIEAKCFEL